MVYTCFERGKTPTSRECKGLANLTERSLSRSLKINLIPRATRTPTTPLLRMRSEASMTLQCAYPISYSLGIVRESRLPPSLLSPQSSSREFTAQRMLDATSAPPQVLFLL